MTYEKLIEALRKAAAVSTAWGDVMLQAADALEAAEKRIEELERILKAVQENSGINFRLWQEAEAQLPKEGKWIQVNGHRYCNVCGHKDSPILTNYCPNCGADMRKGEHDGKDL